MTSSLIDGYFWQVLDTSAGCQEFSGMWQGICTMAQAWSNMCSTTHLHLVEFASMSQTSISVTFWPSIQRQQSACKMFHVPFLWWLYTAISSRNSPGFQSRSLLTLEFTIWSAVSATVAWSIHESRTTHMDTMWIGRLSYGMLNLEMHIIGMKIGMMTITFRWNRQQYGMIWVKIGYFSLNA